MNNATFIPYQRPELKDMARRDYVCLVSLCKRYKVNRLFVFGSVLTDRFNDDSDIDLVVDFKKDEVEDYFDNYFDFKYSLQDLFGRKVDLVEEQSIKNPYFRKSVDSTKQLIYG